MKVLVFGGRDYVDGQGHLVSTLDALHAHHRITSVIHGAARGADTLGGQWAQARGVPVLAFPADWSKGKGAGPARNQRMLDDGRPDLAVQCPGGRGTADMRARLDKANVPVVLVEV